MNKYSIVDLTVSDCSDDDFVTKRAAPLSSNSNLLQRFILNKFDTHPPTYIISEAIIHSHALDALKDISTSSVPLVLMSVTS